MVAGIRCMITSALLLCLGFAINPAATASDKPFIISARQSPLNISAPNIDTNNTNFYNAPPCTVNHSITWNTVTNQLGGPYTASKRTIVLLYDDWESSIIQTFIAQYLLQIMGYRVKVVKRSKYTLGPEFYAKAVDVELEVWPQDFSTYVQVTQVERAGIDLGTTGYNGNVGIYIPSYLLQQYPDWSLDFWRFLLRSEYRSIFPASGTGPNMKVNGSLVCDNMPGLCMNGTYTPQACNKTSNSCIELWHYHPSLSASMFQRIIDGLKLPVTINFLGMANAQRLIQEAINKKEAVLFYGWTPTHFIANNDVVKLLLPSNNASQYSALTKDQSTLLTTEPQSIILHKIVSKPFVTDFPELLQTITAYQITETQVNAMLQRMSKNQWTAAQTACNWVQTNQQIWSRWIAKVPQSVVSCPVGFGRFFLDASYTCLMCPSGTFNWSPENTNQCQSCPKGFDCPGGSVVKVQTGMWMSNRTDIPTAYVCPNEEACCTHDTCLPQTCNDEFSGLLCNECKDPDSYLWGGSCHKCDSKGGFSFYMVLLGAFICALLLLVLPYEEAPTVELLFFYFQVTRYIFETQVHGILSVPGISTFLSITSLNVDGFVSDCTLPISGVPKLMFSFFLPLLILVYIVAIYFVLKTAQSSVPGAHDFIMKCMPYHMKGESISLICLRAIIVTLTFVIMPLVDSSLLLLQCAKVEGANVLSKMPQVQCFGPDHIGAAAFAIVVIVLMLLVLPSVISYLLYKLWRSDMIKYETEGLSPIQTLFQCLYIIYKPEMFYTMPVTIIEKGFIAILFTMLAHTEKHIQTNAYIMVLSALCATRIYWQPFGNHLEAYLNREIALGILAMIALRQYTDQYGVSGFTLAEIGVVIFLPPLFHVLRWIKGNYSKHRDTILEAVKPGLSIRSGAATTTTRGPKNSITKPSVSIRASNNELSSGGQRR